jgi:hypothetical protein
MLFNAGILKGLIVQTKTNSRGYGKESAMIKRAIDLAAKGFAREPISPT